MSEDENKNSGLSSSLSKEEIDGYLLYLVRNNPELFAQIISGSVILGNIGDSLSGNVNAVKELLSPNNIEQNNIAKRESDNASNQKEQEEQLLINLTKEIDKIDALIENLLSEITQNIEQGKEISGLLGKLSGLQLVASGLVQAVLRVNNISGVNISGEVASKVRSSVAELQNGTVPLNNIKEYMYKNDSDIAFVGMNGVLKEESQDQKDAIPSDNLLLFLVSLLDKKMEESLTNITQDITATVVEELKNIGSNVFNSSKESRLDINKEAMNTIEEVIKVNLQDSIMASSNNNKHLLQEVETRIRKSLENNIIHKNNNPNIEDLTNIVSEISEKVISRTIKNKHNEEISDISKKDYHKRDLLWVEEEQQKEGSVDFGIAGLFEREENIANNQQDRTSEKESKKQHAINKMSIEEIEVMEKKIELRKNKKEFNAVAVDEDKYIGIAEMFSEDKKEDKDTKWQDILSSKQPNQGYER